MMEYIGIKFSEHDTELLNAIRAEFPGCQLIHSDELEGSEVFFVAILPLAGFALQLWDFILNHFSRKSSSGTADEDQRAILNNGNAVTKPDLVNKSPDEIKKTLKINLNLEISFDTKNG